MTTNNDKLNNILRARPDIRLIDLERMTGCSHSLVYGWVQKKNHKYFKKLRDSHLRLIKLELGMAEPRYVNE